MLAVILWHDETGNAAFRPDEPFRERFTVLWAGLQPWMADCCGWIAALKYAIPDLNLRQVTTIVIFTDTTLPPARWSWSGSAYESVTTINAETVLISDTMNTLLFKPARIKSLCSKRSRYSSQPFGSLPALISAFSSRVLRCLGTGTRIGSMI